MAKLIIIRGNSGSGKTSLAKALQEQHKDNSMVISQDLVRREMLSVSDGPDTATIPLLPPSRIWSPKLRNNYLRRNTGV